MSTSTDLAKKIWDIFSDPKPPLRKSYFEKNKDALPFSPFREEDVKRSEILYKEFDSIGRSGTDEESSMWKVLERFESLKRDENPDLLFYALKSYLVNYRGNIQFMIPSLLVSEPELVIPSASAASDGTKVEIAVGSTTETKMDWFREDPSLNEHHGHWHIVYNNGVFRDRQGEMFFYMHQQMIARYDADRLSSGVPRVVAYDNLRQKPIQVGYAAGDDVRLANLILDGRDPLVRVPVADGNRQVSHLKSIQDDIDQDYYSFNDPDNMDDESSTINLLGATLESNAQSDNSRSYRNYHGNGHVYIGGINRGVMWYTDAAIRDVVFWEWHKGVDDLYFRLQEKLPAYDFSKDAPPVNLRKSTGPDNNIYSPDLILCLKDDLGAGNVSNQLGQAIGKAAFNGNNWNKDFGKGSFTYIDGQGISRNINTVDTLQTRMKEGTIRYIDNNGDLQEYKYPYLHHDEFCYFIRVENTSLQQKKVTIRIYLAPLGTANDRRSYIEMDKFFYTLPPNSKNVIYRSDTESSVIRKPAVKDPDTNNTSFDPTQIPIDDRLCSCGWPYHMLLPRGTAAGMPFILMVHITDADIDLMGIEPDCGSLSFCGASSNKYPDRRVLGYPFNRKFSGSISDTFRNNKNMTGRVITIKHN